MIPLTTMPPSEDNTPVHYPRRRLVEHSLGYGSPACGNLPYGHQHQHQHQLIVRGSPRCGQYTTAAAQDYFVAPALRREPVEQVPVDVDDGAQWMDSCWRMLTCDGLCSGSSLAAAGEERRSRALMVDVVSRVLFPVMFIIFNIIYWPIYLM